MSGNIPKGTRLFIGIDGGGTSCRARIEDDEGRYLGAGMAGAAATRLGIDSSIAALTRASLAAAEDAGLPAEALAEMHAGVGLAGIGRKGALEELMRRPHPFRTVVYANDAVIACLGAHGGRDGGIVIAGTGSVGLAVANGGVLRVGGYGFPISDEGSGAAIGLRAIRTALRAHDGRIGPTPLARELMARFNDDAFAVVAWSERATATDFASFAPLVLRHADAGDESARRIVASAAQQIGVLVRRLLEFGAPRVSLLGGLAEPLSAWLESDIGAHLSPPEQDAVAGALLLARRRAAFPQSPEEWSAIFETA
ncbi:BadF/BadG/BcrA/BcrD ATPase family protein [Bradyrhizobium sp. LHD-71]|uniref:BadF/BadG/BcrA/BcrD ATPase family protein n=1 Tax=Bradyrhizobium sp. LHD-71 TaxID=3072141 RepID=UPI00280F8B9E|nr:BadF/BadG/BcrA/BcrD ATPase family protein [Bradyrhizobium sp. LHD-71]MDQ8729742.1 BadF/BadG/BcrA/BcrD ATPase family protein [Bradyrhizobium sp. LHD-71]